MKWNSFYTGQIVGLLPLLLLAIPIYYINLDPDADSAKIFWRIGLRFIFYIFFVIHVLFQLVQLIGNQKQKISRILSILFAICIVWAAEKGFSFSKENHAEKIENMSFYKKPIKSY
ncbi:MAG: hypothetical protein JJU02_11400 [Cryomorphaceae bacterium]|nr:hypothetical protein [Cryomorphaceae bacterium]